MHSGGYQGTCCYEFSIASYFRGHTSTARLSRTSHSKRANSSYRQTFIPVLSLIAHWHRPMLFLASPFQRYANYIHPASSHSNMLSRSLRFSGCRRPARPMLPAASRRCYAQAVDVPTVSSQPTEYMPMLTSQENDRPFTVPIAKDAFDTYEFDSPPYTLETTKNELKKLYHDMTTIRSALVHEPKAKTDIPDEWNSPPTTFIKTARSAASATSLRVKKL